MRNSMIIVFHFRLQFRRLQNNKLMPRSLFFKLSLDPDRLSVAQGIILPVPGGRQKPGRLKVQARLFHVRSSLKFAQQLDDPSTLHLAYFLLQYSCTQFLGCRVRKNNK
jgi:hypothetical protein